MGWWLAVVAMAFAAAPDWRAKAWAVHESRDVEFLMRELQDARELSQSAENPEQIAYVQTLFDSLIQSGAKPPTRAVLPFVDHWTAESLILIARSGADEEALLPLAKRLAAAPEW